MKIQYLSVLAIVSVLSLGVVSNRADAVGRVAKDGDSTQLSSKDSNYIASCASKPHPCSGAEKPKKKKRKN